MTQLCPYSYWTKDLSFFEQKSLALFLLINLTLLKTNAETVVTRINVPEGIYFYLYTPQQPTTPQLIDINDPSSLVEAGYNNNFQMKILCHGFTKDYLADPGILTTLKSAYFACAEQPTNIIGIDWTEHAQRTPNDTMVTSISDLGQVFNTAYVGAVEYIETVGQATAQLVNFLVAKGGTKLSNIHLLGFSLGTHTMGFAGHFYSQQFGGKKLVRITALDPSGPCFNPNLPLKDLLPHLNCTIYRHLGPEDAEFVDALHTAANLLGNTEAVGHVDFYVNGGYIQPNCGDSDVEDILTTCSHRRVVLLYAESICNDRTFKASKNCSMPMQTDENTFDLKDGNCDPNETVYMGEYTRPSARGIFYVETNGRSPFSKS